MIAPIKPVSTITSTQINLFPALNIKSSGTLTTSTDGPDPEGEGRDTDGEEDQYEESVPHGRPPDEDVLVTLYPNRVGEERSYPTERERAVKASLLGVVLGLALALFARRRNA